MSKAAGTPSEKCERLQSSPDVRPSQLNLFSSFSCPALPTVSQLQRRSSSFLREARPPEQVCYKHEAQYAMNLFGASPEIDFTIKRGHGAFSPHQGGARRPIIDVAGSRSENSDKCEAAQTLRFWGAAPYIEVVGRRGTGSCSPRIERRDVEASCVRRQHYLQDCHRSGQSDISEVHRLGAGACSPRLGTLPEASTPANLISQETRIASGHSKLGRAVTISPRVVEVEVPYMSLSRSSSPPSSPSGTSRTPRNSLDDSELPDIPRWAQPTSASRARNAQDLSNVKAFLDGSSPRTTRSNTTASVCSSSHRSSFDDTRDTHSCRLGTDSSAASVKSATSRCTHSCRYGSEVSSLGGFRSVRSSFSSASTTSSLASQKSFKLAGDILSELKMPKNTSRSSKASSGFRNWYDAPTGDYQDWVLPPPPAPKLAGNILSNLRNSASRCKGSKTSYESSTIAKDVDPGGHDAPGD